MLLQTGILSCGSKPAQSQTGKLLDKIPTENVDIDGALMIVDKGILVLVAESEKYLKRTILIPANDSIKEIATCSYESRIDNGCRISIEPWIRLNGSYLKKDSIQSIFKFSLIKVLDDGTTCSIISEE